MSNEILNTGDMAEAEWDGHCEPSEVRTDAVATVEPEGKGIEFHVSMRDYTQRDMEALIVEAAAMQIVGKFGNERLAKAIEAKCIELINAKATEALNRVTADIIDQPVIPSYGDKKPVTMRELIGLTGREYLSQTVDQNGKVTESGGWGSSNHRTRMEHVVMSIMERKFATEMHTATQAMVRSIQKEVKSAHDALLAEQAARIRDALAKIGK